MPKRDDVKKVMVIGSGPIIIGQAAEFDYAGTQACQALKAEGIETILVNSNPATIMTDTNMADNVYIEPLTVDMIEAIIQKEHPDSLLPTLGGQTGLNLAMEMAEKGILDKYNIKLLGTSAQSIKKAEDREAFRETMKAIGEPIVDNVIANDLDAALAFARKVGYPVIVRPAYTLGGTGGGIARDEHELRRIASDGLRLSRVHQVIVEPSIAGWKEIEYEVMRDSNGNCITVCNMENIDPVGVHTGDSIVVAPSQTLSDKEYQMLRSASINIINALEIEGGCNVQFALDPDSMDYFVIEVNPRVSRSSALASKATGYPIARVATKIAIGYTLDEIINSVTGKTYACFEPTLDYVVTKIPKWPFDKFVYAEKTLGTRMKATGEVMAISTSLEASLLKAVRSLELGIYSLEVDHIHRLSDEEIKSRVAEISDERLFVVAEALRRGFSMEYIHDITKIDFFFLNKINNIVALEEHIKTLSRDALDKETLLRAKKMGFADAAIAKWLGISEDEVRQLRKQYGIKAVFKMVDTCAAEFEAVSPYYYSTYDQGDDWRPFDKPKVVVLGSGPIRIGQGIEFDYCSVHCVWALREAGYGTIIINNNPETVSTDFDTSDRLYFEPLTTEDVANVLEAEQPLGVVVQFGGQTAIKLTKSVADMGMPIMGTQPLYIDMAEDREEFDKLLNELNIPRPAGATVFTAQEAIDAANRLGYPVLVRPSYVLGGQGMEIAHSDKDIEEYIGIVNRVKQEHPILVDKYLMGKELEVDAICDGRDILIPGIMEHVERAGIHSGDSISVYPAQNISAKHRDIIVDYTYKLAKALHVIGLVNIQFIIYNDDVYIIEVNPRSSRTVPYISKVTGIPMVNLATRAVMGEKLRDMGYGTGLYPAGEYIAVKVPVFSFDKLPDVEVGLGPEMKSTGEVLGIAKDYSEALYKGLLASGIKLDAVSDGGYVLMTVADADKYELIEIAQAFQDMGYNIVATAGTAHVLNANYVAANVVNKINEGSPNIMDLMLEGKVKFVINTPTKGRQPQRDGFKIRRLAVEQSIPCLTSLDTARALVNSLRLQRQGQKLRPVNLKDLEKAMLSGAK
ncbi:carbamoyl-phosphate synthase large subunit [Mahella sp.]|uniref:carbamoyl-phosphate synthase large subunit n=1 Tax=Mahella sp. TaxID=2798721 RepID=UPI0025C4F809|nr:carbamoyl-phosphate synthase large subunit [Mahella sp.]MBZ4665758.1 carbamoyl-phosphate synthase large subunit [Mahella sp.]